MAMHQIFESNTEGMAVLKVSAVLYLCQGRIFVYTCVTVLSEYMMSAYVMEEGMYMEGFFFCFCVLYNYKQP